MSLYDTITRPTLLLNRAACLDNIARMAEKARASGVRFRPHFKTHQSAQVGEWFRPHGVTAITVSSLDMAAYFARHGWDDITVAFPSNLRQMEAINRLAASIRLGLLVESGETARALGQGLRSPADAWIKVDVGTRRTGIPVAQHDAAARLAEQIERTGKLRFRGVLAHAGHTYTAPSPSDIRRVYSEAVSSLSELKRRLAQSFPAVEISYGDTPSCSLVDDLSALDEARPGNFVFYDVQQYRLGACAFEQVAVGLACPVVVLHPERNTAILYGGAVHLSKEFIVEDGQRCYGLVSLPAGDGWSEPLPGARVASLSQEHGVVRFDGPGLEKLKVGDLVVVIPVHSCLTVDLMQVYTTLDGETIATLGKLPYADPA